MAYIIGCLLRCDAKVGTRKCPARFQSDYGESEANTRERAILHQWVIYKGLDYCREHAAELAPEIDQAREAAGKDKAM